MKKTLLMLCSLFALVFALAIAACRSNSLTISFVTNGGTEIPPIEADAGADITDLLPEEPTREGYFFEGWYLEADFSGEVQDLPTVMPEKSVTYYAKWEEGNGAKLVLTTNNGGVLQRTQYNVKVGENLLAFLAGKEPTPKAGLTFAGWYRGAGKVTAADVMPAAGITLTAKYNATYAVEVYRQQTDESYVKDAANLTGTAFYGEPFSCKGIITPLPDHFKVAPDGRTETDSLGINETFQLYLARETHYIVYNANVPEGERVVTDVMPMGTYVHGGTPKLGECGYVLSGHYRFLGWSRSREATSANALLRPGDNVENANNINLTFYAIWEKGYADVFNGGDIIYIDTFAPTQLHLEREGMALQNGTLEADNSFTFNIGTGLTLKGKLIEDEENDGEYTYFFYYRDDYAKEPYTDMDGTSATLEIKADGTVEYKDPAGTVYHGKYSINGDGYFVFEDNSNSGNNFLFNLYTEADGTENVVFRRQDLEEEGYYYDAEANIILYLDGLSGLRYYYNKSNAEHTSYDGSIVYYDIGYYEKKEENFYLAQTRDIVSILKQFTFMDLASTGATVTTADFPDLPTGATVNGTVNMDDGARGEYLSKWGQSTGLLELDGYGNGKFGGVEGTYTLFTWLWSMEGENGDTIETYYLVRFKPDAENSDITYFRLDTGYSEYIIDRTIAADDVVTGIEAGRFEMDIDPDPAKINDWFFILNMSFSRAFVMIYENGEAEVWTLYGTAYPDETKKDELAFHVYYLEPALSRSVELDRNGTTYHFAKDDASAAGLNHFDFTLQAGAGGVKKASVVLPEPHDVGNVDSDLGLTLDYTARKAILGEVEFTDYWYTIGYIDLYRFKLPDGTVAYYWTDGTYSDPSASHANTVFHKIDENLMYRARITAELEETSYIGLLFFKDGKPTAADTQGKETYLAYLLDSGLYRFVGRGTATAKNSTDYEFTLAGSGGRLPDMEEADFEGYSNFTFRTDTTRVNPAEGDLILTFIFEHHDLSYSNFTDDGYGTYTYKSGSNSYVGTIAFTIGNEHLEGNNGEGRLIIFTVTATQESILFRVSGGSVVEVQSFESGGDAWYWYLYDSNQFVRTDTYLVFDGNGTAFLYEYDSMLNDTTVTRGSYARTGNTVSDPTLPGSSYREYRVTLPGEKGEETQTYLFDPAYEVLTDSGYVPIPVYQQLIPHRVGSFDVRGGGTIESDGYPGIYATYRKDGETLWGNMYIGKVSMGTDDHSFTNDAEGTVVHFWALVRNGTDSVSEDYYFNIVEGDLVPLALPYGDYALYANGAVVSNQVLRLDGISSATILINNIEVWKGTYEARGTSEFYFSGNGAGGERAFTFRISAQTSGMDTTYVFEEEDKETDIILTNDDWTVLVLNGYGDAHYINKYGDVIIGAYTIFDKQNGYGAFESDGKSDVFKMQSGSNGTTYRFLGYDEYAAAYYAEDFSSVVLTQTRFIINGEEFFYVVSSGAEEVTLYKPMYAESGVTFTGTEHVARPKDATYTYNQKQYRKYTAGTELTFTNDTYKAALELKFTPDGADFAVAANFAGIAQGYRVVVTYELVSQGAGKDPVLTLKTMLTYLASGMDARVEEYDLVLHYTDAATGGTFTVTPHEFGEFKRYEDEDAKAPMAGTDSVVIEGGHIGVVNLEPKQSGKVALTIHLGIADSLGAPLSYSGTLDNVSTESEAGFNLGNVRAIELQSSDGYKYVLRFWLDESVIKQNDADAGTLTKRFIVHSVVVEKTVEKLNGIDVTFTQLWESGTHYKGGQKLDLVGISATRSSTEEIIFMGALDSETAALVRNRFDPASETNIYEAFVYTIQKDSKGFISSATARREEYKYSEVTTNPAYHTLRFLYTGTAANFEVKYILSFSSLNMETGGATFTRDTGDASGKTWTIHIGQKDYTATITRLSGLGGLTFAEKPAT